MGVRVSRTEIEGVLIVEPDRFGDHRGFFSEVYVRPALAEHGIADEFIQDNHSRSGAAGVVRGLHFQGPPRAQAKLIRVTRGAIFDVAVDIRRGSATYGRHVGLELSEANWLQMYIPAGFAHGFCTLSEGCEVQYKCTDSYAPETEGGLLWNDPALGIDWPITPEQAVLSDRDTKWAPFGAFESPFV